MMRIVVRCFLFVSLVLAFLGQHPSTSQAQESQEPPERHVFTISTMPAVRGMVVMIDDKEYVTDGGGFIRVVLDEGSHDIAPREVVYKNDKTRYLFQRWNDSFDRVRVVEITRDRELQIGVIVQHEIEMRYVDGLGEPFPRSRIQSAVLINSNGDLVTVSSEMEVDGDLEIGSLERIWMTSNRLRRTGDGLISKEAVYSARQVFVDGQDVVQSGKVEYLPTPGGHWRLDLRLYSLFVDVRSFGFNRPVAGSIGIRQAGDTEPFQISETVEGVAEFSDIPVGDFELLVIEGGITPVSPIVFSGPKTEILTVLTPWVRWLGVAVGIGSVLTFLLFLRFERLRVAMLLLWATGLIVAMNVPSIGALGGRPLTLEVEPVFTEQGRFLGIEAQVDNSSSFVVSQVYCKPDFELRVLRPGGVWSATYESPDFHDVEFGECREHRVRPGSERYRLAPTAEQAWVTLSNEPLPPGEYVAYVRLFDIPAPAFRLELTEAIDPATVAFRLDDPTLGDEIPFTSPFEE